MGKPLGFKEFSREVPDREALARRVKHWKEIYLAWPEDQIQNQASRCMDCAVPFCHTGCPLGNIIPDFNDLVYRGDWQHALAVLHSTNNFPDFTGRICPAPCESACVLNINQDPVTIEYIEKALADKGFSQGWITPHVPETRTGKQVAVVGSGPAGLAAAQQLNRAGHWVTVFERDEHIGGLLRLGIPEFKLEKATVQRRLEQIEAEGVIFKPSIDVGVTISVDELKSGFDAICLAGGATQPRNLPIPGHDLSGIHYAMEYLTQQNRLLEGTIDSIEEDLNAKGKQVIILGGGDTGADCLGTAHRQGAAAVHQFELLPEPPNNRRNDNPWPYWPNILRTSAAHEEGGLRDYSILTKSFSGSNGHVQKLHAVRLEWGQADQNGRPSFTEISGSEFEIEADLILLALGFLHPEHYLPNGLGLELDARGNIKTGESHMSSIPGIFAAGDMRRGQSLVVWAIAEGREAAHHIDTYLMGSTKLPRSLPGALPR